VKFSPQNSYLVDGCAIAISWEKGGFALWSVFGSLLTCSWSWTGDLSPYSQKVLSSFDWAAEGYQLWMAVQPNTSLEASRRNSAYPSSQQKSTTAVQEVQSASTQEQPNSKLRLLSGTVGLFGVLSFVKSSLTVNPSMSQIEHLYLQGEDRLLISFSGESHVPSSGTKGYGLLKGRKQEHVNPLGNNKNWVVVMIPNTYLATNWPIRVTFVSSAHPHCNCMWIL